MRSRRVLITVHFRAPRGGLQEHVFSQARGLNERGFKPLIVCPPGPFSEDLETAGVPVIRSDFQDAGVEAKRILDRIDPDLVHAHPFRARELGLRIAEEASCPAVYTFHGLYIDGVGTWMGQVAQIVAVSDGVRSFVSASAPATRRKMIVIPNGVDIGRFRPRPRGKREEGRLNVLVAGRFDIDTALLGDILADTWERQLIDRAFGIRWHMAGSGTQLDILRERARRLNDAADEQLVTWHGWLDQGALASLHRHIDVSVLAGRSALESMASGIPTIAVGQKTYYGPTWVPGSGGMGWNWGHVHADGYEEGSLYGDLLDASRLSSAQREQIGRASRAFVKAFHRQDRLDDKLAALYKMLLATVVT